VVLKRPYLSGVGITLEKSEITPPNGTNPFDNWVSMLHEQHHRKTILGHSNIQKAYTEIKSSKVSLLKNPNMTAPHDSNLRATAVEDLPKHLVTEQGAIRTSQAAVWKKLNLKSAGRLQVVGIQKLLALQRLPNRRLVTFLVNKYKRLRRLEKEYYSQENRLRTSLKHHYKKYEAWMEKARNFATDDLKAYCVSWNAERNVIAFIKRCCRDALRGRLGRRRR